MHIIKCNNSKDVITLTFDAAIVIIKKQRTNCLARLILWLRGVQGGGEYHMLKRFRILTALRYASSFCIIIVIVFLSQQ